MSQIQSRSITCPLCSTSFSGWLVLAGRSPGPVSSELRRFPEDEDPLPKHINACPCCGYTGDVSAFEEMAPKPNKSVPPSQTGAWFSQGDWEDAHDPMLADRPQLTQSTLAVQLAEHLAERAAEAHADPALRYEHHAQVERNAGIIQRRVPRTVQRAWVGAAIQQHLHQVPMTAPHGDRERRVPREVLDVGVCAKREQHLRKLAVPAAGDVV